MKYRKTAFVILALFILAFAFHRLIPTHRASSDSPENPSGTILKARLARVIDGDSVVLTMEGANVECRLIGIDAPEWNQGPWGRRATDHLKGLLRGGKLTVETDVELRDRYNRLLVYLWNDEGELVNLEIVRDGYAILYTFPPNVKHTEEIRRAQAQARSEKRGIWGDDGLKETPREWRRQHRR